MKQAKGKVSRGPSSAGTTEILAFWRRLRSIHRMFAEADQALQEGIGASSCISGCGHCCQGNVPTWMTLEATQAISVFTGEGIKRLDGILSIAEGWLLDQGLGLTLYEGMPHGYPSAKLIEEWARVSRSCCPFLSESKSCLIYKARPLTCMSFGITRDTINEAGTDFCPRPRGKGETWNQKLVVDGSGIQEVVQGLRRDLASVNRSWLINGSVATVLFRTARPDRFKSLVDSNQIATAKLIGTDVDTTIMWQPQVVAMRQGKSVVLDYEGQKLAVGVTP